MTIFFIFHTGNFPFHTKILRSIFPYQRTYRLEATHNFRFRNVKRATSQATTREGARNIAKIQITRYVASGLNIS